MKRIFRLNKKFVSFFLAVMMIWSMGFTGVKAYAATTNYYSDSNNGNGSLQNVTLIDTSEAQLMVRVGDIDNFGFGWLSGFNPFSSNSTTGHDYPYAPGKNNQNGITDWDGTDRIMVTSGYRNNTNNRGYYLSGSSSTYYNDSSINVNSRPNKETTDGYTKWTRPNGDKYVYNNSNNYYIQNNNTKYYTNSKIALADNAVRPIEISFANNLRDNNISILNATLQLFVDDFQAGQLQENYTSAQSKEYHISQVTYKATINGVEIPELSNLINQLNQSGPTGRLITFQIPERYLDLVRTGSISIKIDDSTTTNYSDGYAIDFAKLLINKKTFANTGTITGRVTDKTTGNPISGAKVSAGGVVETNTIDDGTYKLENVPAGLAVITASKSRYNSQSYTRTINVGGGYTQDFSLTPSTPPRAPTITSTPTTITNQNVTATINYLDEPIIKQYRMNMGGATGEWKVYTGPFEVTQNCTIEAQGINQYENESQIAQYNVTNIDKEGPSLILRQNSDGTITATATDNVAVASITKPDNTVVSGSSTTYLVSGDGTYTFKATDTAGNITTKSIVISNLPVINAEFDSYTPNPAKSTDDITLKYNINADPFTLASGAVDEVVVLEDMSQDMLTNSRWSMYQNGLPNQLLDNLGNSNIKFGIVGYNDSVYVGSRTNQFNEPKTQNLKETDENLSNIDTTKFFPFFGLDNGNVKDGYKQFYQNGYIYNNISNNNDREFGTALTVADKLLTQYGTPDAKKAIIIISSGNLSYTDAEIENIKNKGYKIITMDVSNSSSTNIRDTHIKLSTGNQAGSIDNYYIGTFNDQSNYNSTDNDMRKIASNLKGEVNTDTLSIKDAKLNIDLGENFDAANSSSGLEGNGRIRTVTIPEIKFTKNTVGKWVQASPIEVTFKVKPASDKYGDLAFGNNSTISYTNYNGVLINKPIETPTITINNADTEPPTLTLTPSTTNPTSGTVTITAVANDNVAVASITNPDGSVIEFNPATQSNSTDYVVDINGTYTFKATDTSGNVTTKDITISNIDRTGLTGTIIDTINTNRTAPTEVNLGETFDANYTINFNNQTLDQSKPNRQQWLASIKDTSNNMNYQMVNDVQASDGISRASVRDEIKFNLNKNNIKCNESYSFSNDSSDSSLSSRMNDALAAVTQKNSQGHERDIVIMIGTNISDSELQKAITVANTIKNYSASDYKLGINSIVINIGNKSGEGNIKKLAAALGGNYMFLNSADDVKKINDNYISQLAVNVANTADNYPVKQIYFEDKFSDNFQAVSATQSFITIDNTNKKVNGTFYPNYYIESGQIKYEPVTFTVKYTAVSYKDKNSSYIGQGVFNVVNNETKDYKTLDRVFIEVVVPDTTPPTITLTQSPIATILTNGNVTVTATISDASGIAEQKWASGSQDISYFGSGGTTFTGSTFSVGSNGTYTVYARDNAGNENVQTITIGNIDKIPPTIILTQSPAANGNATITAEITDASGIAEQKWASGSQDISYFGSGGTTFTGSTFSVAGNGTYTVYARDNAGNESVKTITIAYSSIISHGIYSGKDSDITASNNVVETIPVTLAMKVDIESSNPVINLSVDDNTKITVDNNSFKGYEISEDGKIGSLPVPLTIDGNGNITGITMQKDKKYLITYTITPTATGNITLTATADGTSSENGSVTLNVGAIPDLF